MGGWLVLLAVCVATLLWADLTNTSVWIVLLVTLGFGAVGFADDYLKVTRQSHHGLSGKVKLAIQSVVGLVATLLIMRLLPPEIATGLTIPFFKDLVINLGWLFVPFAMFVMVGSRSEVRRVGKERGSGWSPYQ